MKTAAIALTLSAALATSACTSYGDDMDMATTSQTMTSVNIVETIVDSPNHTTLESLVKTAGLASALSSDGPFTVFAPTDAAFNRVPAATRTALMQPANREMLTGILSYHAVVGNVTAADLMQRIKAGNGRAMLTTLQGTQLTATMEGNFVKITDATGASAYVETADIMNTNGTIHSINGVLMPRS